MKATRARSIASGGALFRSNRAMKSASTAVRFLPAGGAGGCCANEICGRPIRPNALVVARNDLRSNELVTSRSCMAFSRVVYPSALIAPLVPLWERAQQRAPQSLRVTPTRRDPIYRALLRQIEIPDLVV